MHYSYLPARTITGHIRSEVPESLLLIQFAYGVHDSPRSLPLPAYQVIGGPDWIDTLRYDIKAKTSGTNDWKQIWPMWQTLLRDRFKLRLHRETRDLPTYDLTVAESGPKLPPPKQARCGSCPLPGNIVCGYVNAQAGLHMIGSKVHLADLIEELGLVLDRPVFDKTKLAGEFDVRLRFTPEKNPRGFPGFADQLDNPFGSLLTTDPNLPNIFAALEDQLGLKLVTAQGRVEVLVIDHAERPVEN